MKKKKVLRTTPIKVHLEGGIVGRISGVKLMLSELCMKCAKEAKE